MPRKRIPFSEEDLALLKALVGDVRPIPWKDIAHALGRSLRECRETYRIKFGPLYTPWTEQEDDIIRQEMDKGESWFTLQGLLPERTKSAIKNRWNRLKFLGFKIEKAKIQPQKPADELWDL
jgi:hypothetical protein